MNIGHYLQPDPIGIQEGNNHLYTYVWNNPILYVDPSGLVTWRGTQTGGAALTAGGFRFLLESDCVDGRCAKVEVLAIGAGYAYGPKRLKVTGTTGGVTLWDELHSPDPDVFNGQFYYASSGWAFAKMGQGVSFLRLGAATGNGKPGVLEGVDATIGFLIGSSTVLDYHFEPCCQ